MPSVGDLIQIASCGRIADQTACNVFYFAVGLWTGNMTIAEVLEYFADEHWDQMVAQTVNAWSGTSQTWRNLDNPAEVVSVPWTVTGGYAQESMGPFVALSARLYGETAETRSGWKRFTGFAENQQSNGVIAGASVIDWQARVDNLMRDVLPPSDTEVGADAMLIPVIVGRAADGSLDLARSQPIVSSVVQPRITTQNSRKVGRGS